MTELEVRDLVVSYGKAGLGRPVVNNVSFSVPSGSTLGVVGESGCGKSTLARAITHLVRVSAGEVALDGQSILRGAKVRELRGRARGVQMIFQDPRSSLNPRMRVGETLTETLRATQGETRGDLTSVATSLLDRVGMPKGALDRFPHEFSGGQLQRVAIARGVAARPKVLIADEPTSSLDVSVQATVLNLLRDLQQELGFSMLFISHDLAVVRYMSDRIAVMYEGRVVENASAETVLEEPEHPYTAALVSSIPSVKPHDQAGTHLDAPAPKEDLDTNLGGHSRPLAAAYAEGPSRQRNRNTDYD